MTFTDPGFITWPAHDPQWRDDGQGGLYTWLVVPGPASYEDGPMRSNGGCCVDVWPTLNRPDAPVTRTELWGEYDWRRGHDEGKIYNLVQEHLPQHLDWVQSQTDRRDQSSDVLAAVFLGATSAAYYSDTLGRQFEVLYQHLTPAGKALYNSLRAAFRTEPLLVTLLDT